VQKLDTLENHNKIIFLGIGSNLGNRIKNIRRTYRFISFFCKIINISNYYETKSWPNANYPKYLNIIVKCTTDLSLQSLFKKLKDIEKKLGRIKKYKNMPRTCDIDIIDYNQLNLKVSLMKDVIICPHPRICERNFVLLPLYEVDKKWVHPKNLKTITYLLKKLKPRSLRTIKFFKSRDIINYAKI